MGADLEARRDATASLSTLLLRDGLDRYLTEHIAAQVAGRLVGHALLVRGYLAPCEEGASVTLRQQPRNSYSDEDSILERLHELKAEQSLLNGYLRSMRSPYAPALVDRDDVNAAADDARISRERADEKAAAGMPKGLAS